MTFDDFFQKIYVINLPSRPDRLESVRTELRALNVSLDASRFTVPVAPVPEDADGFPTRGVRGNFLSHLGIIEDAHDRGYERILVLEDDAIFRSFLRAPARQRRILEAVEAQDWSMWFPGHDLRSHPAGSPTPVYPSRAAFKWAHCYVVHRRGIRALRDYLRLVCERPSGHAQGGRMYIDGALTHFRQQQTDHVCLVSYPVLSIQKSSDTNLGSRQDAGHSGSTHGPKNLARRAKDFVWRRTGLRLG